MMNLSTLSKKFTLSVVLTFMGVATPLLAATETFTASIDRHGKVLAQTPTWISEVNFNAQPNYFSDYKVKFASGVFKKEPRFCSVSTVDVSSAERIYYGHAKLGGAPKADYVNVLTLSVGDNKPAGDSSMSFMLMCIK